MNRDSTAKHNDPLLEPYLTAPGNNGAERQLERLLDDHAMPVVRRVVGKRLRVSLRDGGPSESQEQANAQDVCSDAKVSLIQRLLELKAAPSVRPICDLRGYVAVTAQRACAAHLRHEKPGWSALRAQLRYLLSRQAGLAEWEGEGGARLAGFSVWRDQKRKPDRRRWYGLIDDPQGFVKTALRGEDPGQLYLGDLAAAIFNQVGAPIELDALVRIVAGLQGIPEISQVSPPADRDEGDGNWIEQIVDPSGSVTQVVEFRELLRKLWSEIQQLPPRQSAALLLNLTDARGHGIIALLPLLGIASQDEIAGALGMIDACGKATAEFDALWERLPIEDAEVARILCCTRQQVINLRKSARERLARRMKP